MLVGLIGSFLMVIVWLGSWFVWGIMGSVLVVVCSRFFRLLG